MTWLKFEKHGFHGVVCPKAVYGMANSVGPDQTARSSLIRA